MSRSLKPLQRTKSAATAPTEFLMSRTREALLAWKTHFDYMRHRKKIKEVITDLVF